MLSAIIAIATRLNRAKTYETEMSRRRRQYNPDLETSYAKIQRERTTARWDFLAGGGPIQNE